MTLLQPVAGGISTVDERVSEVASMGKIYSRFQSCCALMPFPLSGFNLVSNVLAQLPSTHTRCPARQARPAVS